MAYPLKTARAIAEKIIADIAPYCERCDIAGSVRRKKPEVKDIEICAVPKFEVSETGADLFGATTTRINLLQRHLAAKTTVRWIKPGTSVIADWPLKPDAKYWRGLMPNGIKLDIFLAQPENYGLIYLMRTGSLEFNVALFTHGKKIGMPVADGWLRVAGLRKDTPEEVDVFRWMGIDFVEPRLRTTGMGIRVSEYRKRGLHLVTAAIASLPADCGADWNAVAATSPFVATPLFVAPPLGGIAAGSPLTVPPTGTGVQGGATNTCPRAADYADLAGECYAVTVLEESPTQVRIRFVDGVPRPPGWAKEGWFPRCYLC